MYSTQKPLTALDDPTSLAINQTNFPAIGNFFPCNLAVGTAALTCSITGITITPTGTPPVFDGSKATTLAIVNTDAVSGAFADATGYSPMIMIMGTYGAASKLVIGTEDADTSYEMGAAVSKLTGTAAASVATHITTGTDEVVSFGLDPDDGTTGRRIYTTDATTHTLIVGSGSGGTTGFDAPAATMILSDWTNVYGIAIFHWSKWPDDLEYAQHFIQANWKVGNYVLPPSWKGSR